MLPSVFVLHGIMNNRIIVKIPVQNSGKIREVAEAEGRRRVASLSVMAEDMAATTAEATRRTMQQAMRTGTTAAINTMNVVGLVAIPAARAGSPCRKAARSHPPRIKTPRRTGKCETLPGKAPTGHDSH